jgi:hypothetical protein
VNILRNLIGSTLGASFALLFAGQALADKPPPPPPMLCQNFSSVLTGYNDCVGLTSGNTNVAGANNAFAGDPTYTVEYKDNQTGEGSDSAVFDLLKNDGDSVTLKFLQNVGDGTSTSVIALKFGGQGDNQLGYFRFDLADFDIGEMLTFSWNPSFDGDGISHASVFYNTVGGGDDDGDDDDEQVPEPATYALMLAGLGITAALSRRRRSR